MFSNSNVIVMTYSAIVMTYPLKLESQAGDSWQPFNRKVAIGLNGTGGRKTGASIGTPSPESGELMLRRGP